MTFDELEREVISLKHQIAALHSFFPSVEEEKPELLKSETTPEERAKERQRMLDVIADINPDRLVQPAGTSEGMSECVRNVKAEIDFLLGERNET